MKIGIIGGGSIGLLVANYVARKHQVTLYVRRTEQMRILEDKGISIYRASVLQPANKVKVSMLSELKEEDCYFVCVKQPQMEQVLPFLQSFKGSSPMIFLQNGMGHLSALDHIEQATYVGVVEHGAKRLSDRQVDHLGVGTIKVAAFNGPEAHLLTILKELHEADFTFEYVENWQEMLQNKLIVNAVINPLTALFDVPNGDVLRNNSILQLAHQLCDEAADVLEMDRKVAWSKVVHTANITSANTSSMRADILEGRPTEIQAITGYLLHHANDMPTTSFIYQCIVALEKKEQQKWSN